MKPWTGIRFEEPTKSEMRPHKHRASQIFCIRSGLLHLRTPESSWVVSPQQMVFIPSNYEHAASIVDSAIGWLAYLPADIFLPDSVGVCVLNSSELLESLLGRLSEKGILKKSKMDDALKVLIINELKTSKTGKPGLLFPASENLFQIAEKIRWGNQPTMTVPEWAKLAGMSERSFCRHFKIETGCSFEKWRQLALLQKATELLAKRYNVSDVTEAIGYENPSSFIASFKKQYGLTPKKYFQHLLIRGAKY